MGFCPSNWHANSKQLRFGDFLHRMRDFFQTNKGSINKWSILISNPQKNWKLSWWTGFHELKSRICKADVMIKTGMNKNSFRYKNGIELGCQKLGWNHVKPVFLQRSWSRWQKWSLQPELPRTNLSYPETVFKVGSTKKTCFFLKTPINLFVPNCYWVSASH